MAWEQYIALINLLDWYQKGFQASIQQNPVSSFLHCLFKVTCHPIVCSMSELDSRVLWSLPAKRFCCKREHNSRNHQNPWNYLRQRAMSMCTVDPTSLLLSLQNGEMQWCHNILLICSYFCLCLFFSLLCRNVCFEKKKKTISLVVVSQPYVSRANLLRHSKRHEGCGTILRGWSTNWDVRWFDSFFF